MAAAAAPGGGRREAGGALPGLRGMRADLVRPAAGGVPQEVWQDFPHEVGFLRLGAPGLAVPAGSAVPHGERVPPAAGDQALEGLSRLPQGGLRAADPVSPGGRMGAGVWARCAWKLGEGFQRWYPPYAGGTRKALPGVVSNSCLDQSGLRRGVHPTPAFSPATGQGCAFLKKGPKRYPNCGVQTLGRVEVRKSACQANVLYTKLSLTIVCNPLL